MGLAAWLNTAWMLRCLPEARAFDRAVSRVAVAQEQLLRQTIRANRDTTFGRRHDFAAIGSVADFRRRVPLTRYEDYLPDVARIAAGEQGVLTRDRVELLEPTSGTTAGEKWVPYTAGLRRQFQRAVAAWVADLFSRRPAVRCGRAYWSISPALSRRGRTAGGVRVGFDDDAAYLAGPERLALSRLLVVPPGLSRLPDLDAFRYATLLALLA